MNKQNESICRNCFHSYVCEQFNENKDDNNEKCHFFNDHYVPTADVVPKSEYDAVVSAVDNSTKEFLKLHDDYQEAICEVEKLREINSLLTEAGQEWQKRYNDAKAEVVREIFAEIDEIRLGQIHRCKFARSKETEHAQRNYWEGAYNSLHQLSYLFAELKKKYTEEKHEKV